MSNSEVTRRVFLATSAGAAMARGASTGRLKAGIIGCGGRGTQPVIRRPPGNPDVELAAMADVFEDHLESSLNQLRDPKFIARNVERGGNAWNNSTATPE